MVGSITQTQRTLYKGAKHVSLLQRDGVISLKALDYDGPGAWEGIKGREKIEVPEDIGYAEFGAAIRKALEMSRPGGGAYHRGLQNSTDL